MTAILMLNCILIILQSLYANGVSIPIIAKTLAEAELDRQIVVKAITPKKDSIVN
jgi:hypothetical protein